MPASAREAVLCEGLKTVQSMVARCQYQDVNQSGPVLFSVLFVDHILWRQIPQGTLPDQCPSKHGTSVMADVGPDRDRGR